MSRVVAINQPYFFPYIGNYQLIHASDKFISLGDVNYITRGWINRNRILINGKPAYFSQQIIDARRIGRSMKQRSTNMTDER
jgi:hypothetical protein